MKVFISWSKERSKAVAIALREWLPDVIQSCEPWMSNEDIQAGQRWSAEIENELDASTIGILCVTQENQREPWLNFEAGAISKKVGAQRLARVAPYVVGMRKEDLQPPLSQFQTKEANEKGTFELLKMINVVQERPLSESKLEDAFSRWWPTLRDRLDLIVNQAAASPAPKRTSDEKTDELLETVRDLARRMDVLSAQLSAPSAPPRSAAIDVIVPTNAKKDGGSIAEMAAMTEKAMLYEEEERLSADLNRLVGNGINPEAARKYRQVSDRLRIVRARLAELQMGE